MFQVCPKIWQTSGQGSNSEMLNFKESIEFTDHLCCIWQLTGYLSFHLCGASLTHENTHAFEGVQWILQPLLLKGKCKTKMWPEAVAESSYFEFLFRKKKKDGKIDKRKQEEIIYCSASSCLWCQTRF